jgi:hypothetical protein
MGLKAAGIAKKIAPAQSRSDGRQMKISILKEIELSWVARGL